MKKLLTLMAAVLLTAVGVYSQSPSPGIFNYQGVARNSVGNVLINKTITLRLTIHDGTAAGPVVYQESRSTTTNPFGLFNVQVGSGGASNVTGTIAGVNWGVNQKFIQVEIDPNGGTTFINIGTAQIASVPYALYSSLSNDLVLPFIKSQNDNGSLIKITNTGTNAGSTALEGITNSTAANASAIIGTVSNTSPGGFSAGVRGVNNGTGGLGIGVYGSQNGSGWGVYGTTPSGIGVNGSGGTGTGVNGVATTGTGVSGTSTSGTGGLFTSGTGLALNTAGNLRHTGINEALNRILASDAVGNATWKDPSAVGIVTGSGTLNYVPKWTPNGTNLGNSQIFDNGTSVGINTATPNAAYRLEVAGIQRINNTTNQEGGELRFQEGTLFGAPNHWIIDNFESFAGGNKFRLWNDVGGMNIQMLPGGKTAIGNMVFSDQPQSVLDVEGNLAVGATYSGTTAAPANGAIIEGLVGIGTNAPAATSKLNVDHGNLPSTASTILATSNNATNGNITGVLGNGGWYGVQGFNLNTQSRGVSVGVQGIAGGTGQGNGYGVWAQANGVASVNNYGLYATASGALGLNYAAWLNGRVAITDGTQGLNKVLTSDANGNASWQTLGAGVGVGGSGTLNFVAKWTPNGFNLGNSQLFDDGNTVTVGGSFTAPNSMSVLTTPGNNTNPAVGMISATQAGGLYLEDATGDVHVTLNTNDVKSGQKVMTFEDANLNVGINTVAPTSEAKLHVQGYGGTGASLTRTSIYANGSLASSNGHGVIGDGEWRGVWGRDLGSTGRNEASGVRGDVNGSNYNTGSGVRGEAVGTGNNNYGVYGVATNAGGMNIGVYGSSPVAANNFAGYFDGKLLINDGTQAAGYILTSIGASGEATWSSAAAAGLVSGSGTLNYIPKWTPNGTTLGNSQVFDDGNQVQIGSAGNASTLNIGTTGSINKASVSWFTTPDGFNVHLDNSGRLNFEANNTGAGFGNVEMVLDDDGTQGLAIGTTTVSAKLQVNSAHTVTYGVPTVVASASGIVGEQNSAASLNSGIQVYANGGSVENYGVFGVAGGAGSANMGGLFLAQAASSGNNYGIIARALGGTTNTAGLFQGTVQITDGTQAAGSVFTSDGAGRGSWQGPTSIKLSSLSPTVTAPFFTWVPITQWANVEYEKGSAGNYNSGTGEYTVPRAGTYHVVAHVLWQQPGANGGGYAGIGVWVNGVSISTGFDNMTTANLFSGNRVSTDLNLNAGDKIQIQVFHRTSGSVSLNGNSYESYWSVDLIK